MVKREGSGSGSGSGGGGAHLVVSDEVKDGVKAHVVYQVILGFPSF